MAYSLTYLLPEWQFTVGVWTLMAAELGNLKRWEREFKVIWDFVKLWTLLYWSYLRPTEAKIVVFAAEDSWRGASNNLKVIVPGSRRRWVTSVETRRRSWESATKQLHDNVGEVVRLWRPWGEVRNERQQSLEALCRRLNSFPYAEHQFGSRRRSTNVCDLRQVVRQQACRPFPFL